MVSFLEYTGLHFLCPKATLTRRDEGLFLSHQLRSFRPCYVSCNLFHGKNGSLLLSSNVSTCRKAISTVKYRPISSAMEWDIIKCGEDLGQLQVRSPTSAYSICIGTRAGIRIFRKKRPQKQCKSVESILIRSVLYFVAKQNFLFDFLLNNWSQYSKVVLDTDGDGGEGGGFTFLRGFGGGDDNFSRKRRKNSHKWWWFMLASIALSLFVLSGIYNGHLKLPSNHFHAKRLEVLVTEVGSFKSLALLLIVTAATGSILFGSVKFIVKNSKVTLFSPRRRSHSFSLPRSLNAGSLLPIMGLGMFYPNIPRALAEEICCHVGWLVQNTDNHMRAGLRTLSNYFTFMQSICQKKTARLLKTAATKRNKGRNRRGRKPFS